MLEKRIEFGEKRIQIKLMVIIENIIGNIGKRLSKEKGNITKKIEIKLINTIENIIKNTLIKNVNTLEHTIINIRHNIMISHWYLNKKGWVIDRIFSLKQWWEWNKWKLYVKRRRLYE